MEIPNPLEVLITRLTAAFSLCFISSDVSHGRVSLCYISPDESHASHFFFDFDGLVIESVYL